MQKCDSVAIYPGTTEHPEPEENEMSKATKVTEAQLDAIQAVALHGYPMGARKATVDVLFRKELVEDKPGTATDLRLTEAGRAVYTEAYGDLPAEAPEDILSDYVVAMRDLEATVPFVQTELYPLDHAFVLLVAGTSDRPASGGRRMVWVTYRDQPELPAVEIDPVFYTAVPKVTAAQKLDDVEETEPGPFARIGFEVDASGAALDYANRPTHIPTTPLADFGRDFPNVERVLTEATPEPVTYRLWDSATNLGRGMTVLGSSALGIFYEYDGSPHVRMMLASQLQQSGNRYQALCAHDYTQRDSCPNCDADEEQETEARIDSMTSGWSPAARDFVARSVRYPDTLPGPARPITLAEYLTKVGTRSLRQAARDNRC